MGCGRTTRDARGVARARKKFGDLVQRRKTTEDPCPVVKVLLMSGKISDV